MSKLEKYNKNMLL